MSESISGRHSFNDKLQPVAKRGKTAENENGETEGKTKIIPLEHSHILCHRSKAKKEDCIAVACSNVTQLPYCLTTQTLMSFGSFGLAAERNVHNFHLNFHRLPQLDDALHFFSTNGFVQTPRSGIVSDSLYYWALEPEGTPFIFYNCDQQMEQESDDFARRSPSGLFLRVKVISDGGRADIPHTLGCIQKDSTFYILPPEGSVKIAALRNPAMSLFSQEGHNKIFRWLDKPQKPDSKVIADRPFIIAPSDCSDVGFNYFPYDYMPMDEAKEQISSLGYGSVGVGSTFHKQQHHVQIVDLEAQNIEKYIEYLDE